MKPNLFNLKNLLITLFHKYGKNSPIGGEGKNFLLSRQSY